MNIWPRSTLAHWIQKAKKGEPVKILVSAEKENIYRMVELVTVKGYELYRSFYIQCGEEKVVIKKPSVSVGGYHDDSEHLKRENITIATLRLERDIDRLKKAGIKVEIKNKFEYENIWRTSNLKKVEENETDEFNKEHSNG